MPSASKVFYSMLALSAISGGRAFAPAFARAGRAAERGLERSCSSLSMADMSPSEYISAATSSNDVVVFSKSYCPFCTSTKNLFAEMGTELGLSSPAFVVELDNLPGGGDVQSELLKMTGQRTVPNVFVKGKHLGGNDDTQRAAADGTISQMLGN
ncbi:hypothetical protein TrRE_jg10 [Triparma retinervis]|uniref:Glutaredoxin domain-containing protein n=1 Tax=Triparma retinervis TaxID=2557542 RepID=A0A9W7FYZ5_9STRA|nr:hypothetical protein TrRE_jg10 [Triparma retinervis]